MSYTIDTRTDSIRYTAARLIESGEELCIFYGHNLWFEQVRVPAQNEMNSEPDDVSAMRHSNEEVNARRDLASLLEEDLSKIVPEPNLPFTRIKLTPDDEEEEELGSIRTSLSRPRSSSRIDHSFAGLSASLGRRSTRTTANHNIAAVSTYIYSS